MPSNVDLERKRAYTALNVNKCFMNDVLNMDSA